MSSLPATKARSRSGRRQHAAQLRLRGPGSGDSRDPIVPFGGLAVAVWLAWGHDLHLADVLLAAAFYLVTGLGVTIGWVAIHRRHHAFAVRPGHALCPGLVRVALLQHVTWSVNSLCHVLGNRPFTAAGRWLP
jgi:fatty-acid desaturase